MSTQREQLLLTQATQAVIGAYGGAVVYGDSGAGPQTQRGVILAFADTETAIIHSETYWHENEGRFRYRVVTEIRVEREGIEG